MPSLPIEPLPVVPDDTLMLYGFFLDRIGPTGSPNIRVTLVDGHYTGNTNQLGFPEFVRGKRSWEIAAELASPEIQGLLAAREAEFKEFIAAHPEVPLIVVVDNYLAQLALDLWQARQAG